MLPPIIVIGFSRPAYLDKVLRSLALQQGCDIASRKVAFFQDGAVNEQSGIRYASDSEIAEVASVFRCHFPAAPLFHSERNVGIYANFDRAERYAFEELDAEVAYFFEDDLVLTPHYISAMDQIWDSVKDIDRIGYFAAYGERFSSLALQKEQLRATMPMRHNWAFGLKRSHWREMRVFLKPYYDVISARDYHERDHDAIRRWYLSLGHAHEATSQDGAKALATNLLDRFRLLTLPCFAKYIGELGVHTTPALFKKEGFADAQVYDGVLQGIDVPTDERLKAQIADERATYRKLWTQLQSAKTTVLATRYDVISAYRLFLGRDPETEDVINLRTGVPLSDLIESFRKSVEYKSRVGGR
jgi:hypothetical protein